MIDFNEPQKIIVKTLAGCEGLLQEELIDLGCKEITPLTRAVMLEGTWDDIYKINYTSRFALNVLVNISNFTVKNYDDIYNGAKRVHWERFLSARNTFVIKHAINSPDFPHTQMCALRYKDAIADYFTEKFKKRPSVDKENPEHVFHIHISGNRCQLLIDTTGVPLYKRGYKSFHGFAPLSEILSAAMVKWSGWDGSTELIDPFCGSASILTEAYLQAVKRPAGFYRKQYAFMNFKGFDKERWDIVRKEFNAKEIPYTGKPIIGYEINIGVANGTQKNIDAIGATKHISIYQGDFFKIYQHKSQPIFITNPPYGKRIEPMDESFFSNLSSFLKHNCPGSRVVMIAPKELVSKIGFKPAFKTAVFNGEIECFCVGFELFKGSKKTSTIN